VGNLRQQVEDLRDRNLAISDATREYLGRDSWSPIMAALLVSGIRPSADWEDVLPAENHSNDKPISHRDLFVELRSASKTSERGLDNERIPRDSPRYKCVEHILLFWDQLCSEHNDYPIDLPPKDFVVWLWGQSRQGYVHIPDSTWLDTFVNNYPLKHFNKFVPREVLAWLTASSKKAWELSPKHKFGREIAEVRAEAKQAGDPSDDPDEILSRLAEKMRKDAIADITLLKYSRKSNIQYRHKGDRGTYTLRRDSFARQLRRMIAKESTPADPASPPVPSDESFPDIKAVAVSPGVINKFTSNEEVTKLAGDLLGETIDYVRWTASLQVPDGGWPLREAVLVGNVARLVKLLVATNDFAASKMFDMFALMAPLAMETMVDLKYLAENLDAKLLDSYVGIPAIEGSKARTNWTDLDLKQKAKATGSRDGYVRFLQDALFHLHGSWKDLTEHHLSPAGDGRYQVQLTSTDTEPDPELLITMSIVAINVIHSVSNVIASGPVKEHFHSGLKNLYTRLKIADEEFARSLPELW
jgi:hypothetical protein